MKRTVRKSAIGRTALCLVLIITGCGCADKGSRRSDKDIQKRLKFTIGELTEHAPMDPALPRLKAATPESLKTPELVFAKLIEHSGRLWVSWIEANPSVNAVKITSSQGEFSDILALQPSDIRANDEEAKRVVLYSAIWVYDTGSKEQHERDKTIEYNRGTKDWGDLVRAIEQGACNVTLLRDGIAVSNTVKLEPRGFSTKK